jgi:pimeloyl-ACP methyl ester carboxylesterase
VRAFYLPDLDAFVRYVDLPGEEPPLVWLHGLGRSSLTLAHVAANECLRGRRSLLVDLLGFGISDKPQPFSYTLDDHADTVARLLDELAISKCALIGHSLGGAVAVVVAARRPERVCALVVAEGNLDPGGAPMSLAITAQSEEHYVSEGFERSLEQMRAEARANPDSIFAITVAVQQVASPTAMYRTARALVELTTPTVREQLLGLEVPRTFIVGAWTLEAEEKPPSGEAGEGLEGTGVTVSVVPDAGHPMMFQNPDGLAAAIADAVARA